MLLKPCPFCVVSKLEIERISIIHRAPPYPLDFYVTCDGCGGRGPWAEDDESARRLWNQRIAETPMQAQIHFGFGPRGILGEQPRDSATGTESPYSS
jgi:Restriction alleviation protein Lar